MRVNPTNEDSHAYLKTIYTLSLMHAILTSLGVSSKFKRVVKSCIDERKEGKEEQMKERWNKMKNEKDKVKETGKYMTK